VCFVHPRARVFREETGAVCLPLRFTGNFGAVLYVPNQGSTGQRAEETMNRRVDKFAGRMLLIRVAIVTVALALVCGQSASASLYVGDGYFHLVPGSTITPGESIEVANSSALEVSGVGNQLWGSLVIGAGCEFIFGGPNAQLPDPLPRPLAAQVPEPGAIAIWSVLAGLGALVGWRRWNRAT